MKILVTGANGFIGSSVVRYLINQSEHRLCILIRRTSNIDRLKDLLNKVEIFYGDIRDKESLVYAVKDVDIIIHSAAVLRCIKPDTYYEVNHIGTKNLMEVAMTVNPNLKGIIYLSSQAAAGPCNDINPKTTFETCTPVSHYGRSKLLAEQELKKYDGKIKVIVLRPAAVYGPYDKDMYIYFKLANFGILPTFSDCFYIQFTYVCDLVKVVSLVVKNFADLNSGIYFIAEDTFYEIRQIREIFSKIVGKEVVLIKLPYFIAYLGATINEYFYKFFLNKPAVFNRDKLNEISKPYWLCQSSDIKKIFPEFEYTKLIDGLRETFKWYKDNGWL